MQTIYKINFGNVAGTVFAILITILLILSLANIVIKFVKYQKMLHAKEEYVPSTKKNHVKTTGYFTGKKQEKASYITKTGLKQGGYSEYEVKFRVDGEMYTGWYHFYPAPDPLIVDEGREIEVAYQEGKPWNFEIEEIKWDF